MNTTIPFSKFPTFLSIVFLLFLISACKKPDDEILKVTTDSATNISFRKATLNGAFSSAGDLNNIREFGFEIGDNTEKIIIGSTPASTHFSHEANSLDHDMLYEYRAYAKDKDGNFYFGENVSFKTKYNPDAHEPEVTISNISYITSSSAVLTGMVLNDGGSWVTHAGFCIDTLAEPLMENSLCFEVELQDSTFQLKVNDLLPGTKYFVVAYGKNKHGIGYSVVNDFITSPYTEPFSDWIHYDNGENFTGMALTNGTSFDVAMRFLPEQLENFLGMYITRIKFYPRAPTGTEYTLRILTGELPRKENIRYEQLVEFHLLDRWNDVELREPYRIRGTEELWIGYHIEDQAYNTYPAGIDNGPSYPGYSDLFSIDSLNSWSQLSNFGYFANWNLQIFVTNEFGKEIPLLPEPPVKQMHPGKNMIEKDFPFITSAK